MWGNVALNLVAKLSFVTELLVCMFWKLKCIAYTAASSGGDTVRRNLSI
jgi:hypothetical protein